MTDISIITKEFYELRHDIEEQILGQVAEFVAQYGIKEENVVTLDLNPKEISPLIELPQTIVETDRMDGEMHWETIDSLYLTSAGNGLIRVNYSTKSYTDSIVFLQTDTLIDIHGLLHMLERGLEDIQIVDGKLVPRE